MASEMIADVCCRSADLEVVLATDLNQLGQVSKLQALAISTLRTRLLKELESVITQLSLTGCSCVSVADDKTKQACSSSQSMILYSYVNCSRTILRRFPFARRLHPLNNAV